MENPPVFYLFHHMPKCGGTSFRAFLNSVFKVHNDYVGTDPQTDPERFQEFGARPLDLAPMTPRDCIVGHYNIDGIRLHERFPDLERRKHRKFSILREPLDAARSGIRYNIKRGLLPASIPEKDLHAMLLRRATYFARTFGVKSEADLPGLFDRYWFIAPLDRIDHAMRIIETRTGRKGKMPPRLNTTSARGDALPDDVAAEFKERAYLDYRIYDLARLRFGGIAARILDPKPAQARRPARVT